MKKYILICIMRILILGIALNIKPIVYHVSEIFFDFICEQLDKEEAERERRIANGELVRGKDTILIWGNMYEIGHFSSGNHLTLEGQDVSGIVLGNVRKHKRNNDKLYIISNEGYAVIDENNFCRVFIMFTEDELADDNSQYEKDGQVESKKILHEKIVYISSYNDFSSEEKKVFEKLEKKR